MLSDLCGTDLRQDQRIRAKGELQFAAIQMRLFRRPRRCCAIQLFHLRGRGIKGAPHRPILRQHVPVLAVDTLNLNLGIRRDS
jgi:hypothetical protein